MRAACLRALPFLLALSMGACLPTKKDPAKDRDADADLFRGIAERRRATESGAGQPAPGAIPGMADYQEGLEAVGRGDIARAVTSLSRATEANTECAEFWYNLGAAQANLAIIVVNEDEAAAVAHFRDSVSSKRRSLDLMKQGKFQFYNESQQQQVRSDAEQGLVDADAVLADEPSLIAALHQYAGGR